MARVAIITGAAKGLGFACAERFATDGYDLALVDADEDGLSEAVQTIEATWTPGNRAVSRGLTLRILQPSPSMRAGRDSRRAASRPIVAESVPTRARQPKRPPLLLA